MSPVRELCWCWSDPELKMCRRRNGGVHRAPCCDPASPCTRLGRSPSRHRNRILVTMTANIDEQRMAVMVSHLMPSSSALGPMSPPVQPNTREPQIASLSQQTVGCGSKAFNIALGSISLSILFRGALPLLWVQAESSFDRVWTPFDHFPSAGRVGPSRQGEPAGSVSQAIQDSIER
jgi:hypothetical protein